LSDRQGYIDAQLITELLKNFMAWTLFKKCSKNYLRIISLMIVLILENIP
jgi:hypothetical protein